MGSVRSVEVIEKEIEDRYRELADVGTGGLTDGEVLDSAVRSQRLRSMADAHAAVVADKVTTSKAWVPDGARSAPAWLAWRGHLRRERASGSFSTARRLWAAPDTAEENARRRYEGRRLHCSRTLDDNVILDGLLDPITGEIVLRELTRLEGQLFDHDLAEARERLGPDAPLDVLRRTPAQRRADALRLMAERSAAKPAGAVEPRILMHVFAGHESVDRMCELSNGRVVTPGEVLPVLDRAEVARAIFDGPSNVTDLGVRRRLFTGATRLAVQLRDRQCVHPSCDTPAEDCEVDHIRPYNSDGLTVQANGRCLCKFHHHRARPPGTDPP